MSRELPQAGIEFPSRRDPELDVWARGRLPEPEPEPEPAARSPHINVLLFLATVYCVFQAQATEAVRSRAEPAELVAAFLSGWKFAVPFLTILLVHEFGHYIAARIHRVDASLPYFLPLPGGISPFGTLGAVIAMRGRIRS
jgi:hypothetical protein